MAATPNANSCALSQPLKTIMIRGYCLTGQSVLWESSGTCNNSKRFHNSFQVPKSEFLVPDQVSNEPLIHKL